MKSLKRVLVASPIITAIVVVVVVAGASVMAAWGQSHDLTGNTGSFTVTAPVVVVNATDEFNITSTAATFTGSAIQNSALASAVAPITIHNAGTAASGGGTGGDATITSIAVSSPNLPAGWTVTGSLVEASVTPGGTGTVNVVLHGDATTTATVGPLSVPAFTITLTASGT